MARILLIDDDPELTHFLRGNLEALGHAVECLDRAQQGPELLDRSPFDLVLLDNVMPGMTGVEFLEALRSRAVEIPVVLMTGFSNLDTVNRAMNLGAFDYVPKPADFQSLLRALGPVIREALEVTRPAKPVRVAAAAPPRPAEGETLMTGQSPAMARVCKEISLFARTGAAVLIRGETGTGKELVARAIHANSPRKDKRFVALNCTALTETLLESELFGHEANAFTGAKLRKGKFEYANGGTIFLDEIGHMPRDFQSRLLRVIEYQEVVRLGGNEPIKVDVRLLSATNRDLEAAIQEGEFRSDLFYRLTGATLRLPPLRERPDDLPVLVDYFLARRADEDGRPAPAVSPAALEQLRRYPWPGNVRELRNTLWRAYDVCRGSQILPSHLGLPTGGDRTAANGEDEATAGLRRAIEWAFATGRDDLWPLLQDMLEKELLRAALERHGGNHKQVADKLGMARGTVINRVKKYGLEPE